MYLHAGSTDICLLVPCLVCCCHYHHVLIVFFPPTLHYSHAIRHEQLFATFLAGMEAVFQPGRELWQMGYHVYGVGSLVRLLRSTSTDALIAKEMFMDYCEAKKSYSDDDNNSQYLPFVKFCDECLKLWDCTCEEVSEK